MKTKADTFIFKFKRPFSYKKNALEMFRHNLNIFKDLRESCGPNENQIVDQIHIYKPLKVPTTKTSHSSKKSETTF